MNKNLVLLFFATGIFVAGCEKDNSNDIEKKQVNAISSKPTISDVLVAAHNGVLPNAVVNSDYSRAADYPIIEIDFSGMWWECGDGSVTCINPPTACFVHIIEKAPTSYPNGELFEEGKIVKSGTTDTIVYDSLAVINSTQSCYDPDSTGVKLVWVE